MLCVVIDLQPIDLEDSNNEIFGDTFNHSDKVQTS